MSRSVSQRRSAIAACSVIVILVTGLAAAVMTVSGSINRASGVYNEQAEALYRDRRARL